MQVSISTINWQRTIPLRHSVLWPQYPPQYCHIAEDSDGFHFGAFYNHRLVSVGSLFLNETGIQLRKFATQEEFQHQGIGSQMMRHMIEHARQMNASQFYCDARIPASLFYQRFGLQRVGESFYKENILYSRMILSL